MRVSSVDRARAPEKKSTYDGLIVEVVVPLMRLLELLELVDAGGDGGRVLRRVGDHLAIGVVLRALVRRGVDVVAGRVVSLPAGEWFSDVEAHTDGEVVRVGLKRTGAVTQRGALQRGDAEKGGAGAAGEGARWCSLLITGRTGTAPRAYQCAGSSQGVQVRVAARSRCSQQQQQEEEENNKGSMVGCNDGCMRWQRSIQHAIARRDDGLTAWGPTSLNQIRLYAKPWLGTYLLLLLSPPSPARPASCQPGPVGTGLTQSAQWGSESPEPGAAATAPNEQRPAKEWQLTSHPGSRQTRPR